MEAASAILGGLGIIGIIGAVLLGALVLVLIPIWSIFDCAYSNRDSGTKALVIILIFLSWTLGSLIYSLFFTSSRALRRFTIISLVILVIVSVASVAFLLSGAGIHSKLETEHQAAEERQVRSAFTPGQLDPAGISPFKAIHFVNNGPSRSSAAVADFTLAGADTRSALNIDEKVRHIVQDPSSGVYYGITQHDFGIVRPTSREFEEIPVDPSIAQDFSWPKGLAFDRATGEVVILTSHVDSNFFVFAPSTKQWTKVPTGIRGRSFIALTYSPEKQTFYTLEETRGPAIASLERFNRAGADVGSLPIQPAIPISSGLGENVQMAFSSDRIVLILPAEASGAQTARIFAIDPEGGGVFVVGPPTKR